MVSGLYRRLYRVLWHWCRSESQRLRDLFGYQALSTLASLLAVEESALEAMLTQRTVVTTRETFTKQLGLEDANFTRDAIVKSLYEVGTR